MSNTEKKTCKGAIVVFVKTPGISPVKTRLAAEIGKEEAEKFYRWSCKKIEKTLAEVESSRSVDIYWAVAESDAMDHPLWRGFKRVHQGEGQLGDRLGAVYEELASEYEYLVFLGADSPQLHQEIFEALDLLESGNAFVAGPAEDGGYYLFGSRNEVYVPRHVWTSVPYSAPNTLEVFAQKLQEISDVSYLESAIDVDTKQDLDRISYQ